MNRLNQPAGMSPDQTHYKGIKIECGEGDQVLKVKGVDVMVMTNQAIIKKTPIYMRTVMNKALIPEGDNKGGILHSFFESSDYYSMLQLLVKPTGSVEEDEVTVYAIRKVDATSEQAFESMRYIVDKASKWAKWAGFEEITLYENPGNN